MHLGMHRHGLAVSPRLRFGPIVVCAMMVVSGGNDLSSFYHHGPKFEGHGRLSETVLNLAPRLAKGLRKKYLRGCDDTLRVKKLALVHHDSVVTVMYKFEVDCKKVVDNLFQSFLFIGRVRASEKLCNLCPR